MTIRPVPGFEDYLVDDSGEIYSMKFGRKRRLKGWLNNHGYRVVHLRGGGSQKRMFVHRAVALAFHGNPRPGQEVRHLDGNNTNNHASNLAWGTRSENMCDALRHGTHVSLHPEKMLRGDDHPSRKHPERVARGEGVGGSVLTEKHVAAIRALTDLGFTISDTARTLSVPRGTVKCVVQGKTWRHVARETEVA